MTVDLSVTDETTQEEMEEIMDKKIETAVRLELTDCLFCTEKAETFERYAFSLLLFEAMHRITEELGVSGTTTSLSKYDSKEKSGQWQLQVATALSLTALLTYLPITFFIIIATLSI